MKREHIRFEEWELESSLPEEHLAECGQCRGDYDRVRFLRLMSDSAPDPEIPPFFSSRVAQLALSGAHGFWEILDGMARRLIPALSSLVLVASLSLYFTNDPVDQDSFPLGWLVEGEEEELLIPETLDQMLLVLAQAARDEGGDAEQH